MYNFTFQNETKIYFGDNQLENLSKEVKVYGKKVLLCYGGGSIKKIGLYDKVVNELKSNDIQVYELSGIEPNPRHTTVNKGAAICKKEKIDLVLAVGGGSTIDCAKAVAAANYYNGDVWDLVTHKAEVTKALNIVLIVVLSIILVFNIVLVVFDFIWAKQIKDIKKELSQDKKEDTKVEAANTQATSEVAQENLQEDQDEKATEPKKSTNKKTTTQTSSTKKTTKPATTNKETKPTTKKQTTTASKAKTSTTKTTAKKTTSTKKTSK